MVQLNYALDQWRIKGEALYARAGGPTLFRDPHNFWQPRAFQREGIFMLDTKHGMPKLLLQHSSEIGQKAFITTPSTYRQSSRLEI